jgi:hypothetical protein
MATGNDKHTTPRDVLAREAEAEIANAELLAESEHRLADRCPECGSIGSLEEIDGVVRCIDCDEVVAAQRRLGGLGRK